MQNVVSYRYAVETSDEIQMCWKSVITEKYKKKVLLTVYMSLA